MIELYLDNEKIDMLEDFNINMTYQQTDLKNPEAKLNNYSKSINIPGTNNNNNIFGHIFRFDNNIKNTTGSLIGVNFDPNKRIPFAILDNGSLFETGYAQLDNISIENNNITYSITLYGGLGKFFYNLKVNDDGSEKTLYDLNYGIIDIEGKQLTNVEENNNILFELDAAYIQKAWNVILNKLVAAQAVYDSIPDNDIRKLICPIPCYQGYYENFDSDTVLCETTGLNSNSVLCKSIYDGDNRYSAWNNWVKVKLDREVSNIEINDIRSHYLPYAIRLQSIYDAIKNPDNNGGYIVDDSNVSDIEKKYIYEAFLLQNPFEWDDVNANNINTTIVPTWNANAVNLNNRGINTTSNILLTNYINPNTTLYILPRLIFDYDIEELHTMVGAYPIIRKYGGRYNLTYKGFFGESVQYFWVEAYDVNNNLVKISDVYLYGDKRFDDNGNPYFLYNIYRDSLTEPFSGPQHSNLSTSIESIKYFLDRNGLKLRESSLTSRQKQYYEGYYINDNDKGTAINISHIEAGYKSNNSKKEFVGNEFKIDLKLTKEIRKLVIKTDSIITTYKVQPEDRYSEYGYTTYIDDSTIEMNMKPGFASFYDISQKQLGTMQYEITVSSSEVNFNNILGMIGGESQIYDGSVETLSERHTVNKFTLFQNTKSPYEYLISMCKMFNWKIELNSLTNKVYIYSFKNYYKNNVIDINDFIDHSNMAIIPTTSTSNIYNLSLNNEDTYCASTWYKLNKSKYGEVNFSTNFEFNEEPNKLMEDVIFKNSQPYIQKSVYYNPGDAINYPKVALGKYVEVTMWNETNKDEKSDKRFGLLRDNPTTLSQNTLDKAPRLCFFDSEYNKVDMANTLIFFNAKNTNDGLNTAGYTISDNIQVTTQLNGNNCYYFINSKDRDVIIDINNQVRDKAPIYNIALMPCFNTHFESDGVEYYGTMAAEPLENRLPGVKYENTNDIYNICWKKYLADLYNKNNKIVTLKVKLYDAPLNAMKMFYTFNNAVWVINKIIDYNKNDYFNKVEFIQVQNKNNYLGI